MNTPTCLMFNDIKKAFFYAPAARPLDFGRPEDDKNKDDGDVMRRLEGSLYGTRGAARNWGIKYTSVLEGMGFAHSASSPCTCLQHGAQRVYDGSR